MLEPTEIIRRAILRYSMLTSGHRLAVAVSGGADSVALLAALRELAPALGIQLAVAHVNHGLRGEESAGDQRFVEDLARAAGLPLHLAERPVPPGENLEQAARQARLAFFAELVSSGQADKVATAHTEDDQAETVLLRLLRGAGSAGLAGILPVTREGLIRPALEVSRAALRRWATAQRLAWREDSSNADPAFDRNRLRRDLMPLLERDWNPRLAPLLAQTAQLARQENELLESLASTEAGRLLAPAPYGGWILGLEEWRSLPAALRSRVVRKAIERVRGDLHRVGYEHVARILDLAEAAEGDGRLQIPGVDVLRSFAWVRFAPWPSQAPEARNWTIPVRLQEELQLPGQACGLRLQIEAHPGAYNECTDWLDLSAEDWDDLEIRNWRPGDYFQVEPSVSAERVKLLFQQCRIPLWERRNWPMVARKDEVVWMLGLGVAANRRAGTDAARVLAIKTIRPRPAAVNMRNRLNLKHSSGRLLS